MVSSQKAKVALETVFAFAGMVVALKEFWDKHGDQIKAIVVPFIENCKQLVSDGEIKKLN